MAEPYRILIADEMSLRPESLIRAGFELEYVPNMPREVLLERLTSFDALITRSRTRVDAELIDCGPRLRVIGRGGVGVDNIDLESASRRGILVLNAPEANTVSAAELTIAHMLAASRGVTRSDALIRQGVWDRKFLGREVHDKTLGIIGLGRIGSLVATRAQGLRMRVIAFDPYLPDHRFEQLGVERMNTLEVLLEQAHVLTVHTPLNEETTYMIGARELARLPFGAVVLNVARGGIIAEQALAAALEDGHVFAAGIDVFVDEPPSADHPLIGRADVTLTAHLGANTTEAQDRVGSEIVEGVCAALEGDVSRGAVNAPAIDARVRDQLGPYMTLAERLGRLLVQLEIGPAQEIEVEFAGDFPGDTDPVQRSVLIGYLRGITAELPNLVNARAIARERGIALVTRTTPVSESYVNEIRVTVSDGKRVRKAAGTCFGKQPRLTRIRESRLELAPEGYVLICTNIDRPGVVGRVGTMLGEAGVNIAGMQLGRDIPGGKALFTLSLDSAPNEVILQSIRELEVIESMYLVNFEGL